MDKFCRLFKPIYDKMKMFYGFENVFGSFQNPFAMNIFNLFVSFCA